MPQITLLIVIAAAFALPHSLSLGAEQTKDLLKTVKKNVDEEKAVLVDVREKSEWDDGHIEGSVFLPLSTLKKKSLTKEQLEEALPEDRILYTFCVVGKRSVAAGEVLEKFGYEVRPLKPGYKELLRAGFKKAKDKK